MIYLYLLLIVSRPIMSTGYPNVTYSLPSNTIYRSILLEAEPGYICLADIALPKLLRIDWLSKLSFIWAVKKYGVYNHGLIQCLVRYGSVYSLLRLIYTLPFYLSISAIISILASVEKQNVVVEKIIKNPYLQHWHNNRDWIHWRQQSNRCESWLFLGCTTETIRDWVLNVRYIVVQE